ncbi:MATE family efflux transporter [Aliiglaciecola litoralis]|uniref:Multidrug-efflux transporter n=1 Tax=Aliiglaciecola litoralis TaxID=582857 RepID=A0ABN1LCH0_9ALTE
MTLFKIELKNLVRLAWPLLIAQVTQTLMGVSDTIMAGRFSAVDMAAVAIGFSITFPLLSFIQGLAMAIPPIVSNYDGAGKTAKISEATQQAAYLILPCTIMVVLVSLFVPYWFSLIDMEESLRKITVDYVLFILYSSPAFAAYQVLRNYCEGLGKTKPTMVIMGVGLLVNIPANYLLIYGKLGLPAMGGVGCGVATALVYIAMMIATALYVHLSPTLRKYGLFTQLFSPQLKQIMVIAKLGTPIALTILFEVTLFGVVALLLSPLGAFTVAAHQIALNFSSLMFMFPLSLGMATSIRVGYFLGREDLAGAKVATLTAIALGLCIAVITAGLTIFGSTHITELYTTDPVVRDLAISLMTLAAMFQLSDSVQAISAGALRGYKDTNAMFIITFLAYWGVGLPTGVILALTDWIVSPLGAPGFWIGFICGLTSAAVMLGLRLRFIQQRLA